MEQETLWSSLQRRKVIRSLGLYLAGAWLVIQVASLLADIWSLPGSVVQNIFVLLVLGAPLVTVLSWIYDLRRGSPEAQGSAFSLLLRRELQDHPLRATGLLLGVTLAVLVAVAYVWPDEELSPQARKLRELTVHGQDDPRNFNYGVLGFHAPAGEEIWDHGRVLLENQAAFGAEFPEGPGVGFSVNPDDLCPLRETGCAARWLAAVPGARQLLEANALPLARYRQLHEAQTFGYPLRSFEADTPLPDYSNVALAAQLELLDALQRDANGDPAGARELLARELAFHRRLIARSSLMVTRMVGIAMVQNDLRVIALLDAAAAARGEPVEAASIPVMTIAERSKVQAMGGEIGWLMQLTSGNHSRAELASMLDWPSELSKAAFQILPWQRNATLNRIVEDIAAIARESRLSAAEFRQRELRDSREASLLELYRNGAASMLIAAASIDFSKYIERGHDLDALIVLVNVARRLHREGVAAVDVPAALLALPPELRDPYTGDAPVWEAGELRFTRDDAEERRVPPRLPFVPAR